MPSLSFLISAASATNVVIVATVTLLITVLVSLDSIYAVGLGETRIIADLAGTQLDSYLSEVRDGARAAALKWRSGYVPYLRDDPAAGPNLARDLYGIYRSGPNAASCTAYFRDGTKLSAQRNPNSLEDHIVVFVQQPLPNNAYVMNTWSYNRWTGHPSPANITAGAALFTNSVFLFAPSAPFGYVEIQLTGDRINDVFLTAPIGMKSGSNPAYLQLSMFARVINASGTAVGVVACGAASIPLTSFMVHAKATPNTVLILIGSDQRMLVTTWDTPAINEFLNMNRSIPVPAGCVALTASSSNTSTALSATVIWECRKLLSEYEYAPAAEYARGNQIPSVKTAQRMTIAGQQFFVEVRPIDLPRVVGNTTKLLVFLPVSDLTGDVVKGYQIAIGVTVAVLVVCVIASWLTSMMLLRPLNALQARMALAASFEDEDTDLTLSTITEVRDLQESYYILNAELQRISAFVPQTILAARKMIRKGELSDGDNNSLADDDDRDENNTTTSHTSKRHSQRHSGTRFSRTSGDRLQSSRRTTERSGVTASTNLSDGTGASMLNLSAGLVDRNCSILFANCVGFNDLSRHRSCEELNAIYTAFVTQVQAAVTAQRGVVDSVHGDRIMATFNCAAPTVQHMKLAATAAVALAARAVPDTLRLSVCIGVASGKCRMGNVGSATMKRFCVMGSAVTRASKLCDMGLKYKNDTDAKHLSFNNAAVTPTMSVPQGSVVLIPASMLLDLETYFSMQCVDFLKIIESEPCPKAIASILSTVPEGAHGSEWLYVVAQGPNATTPFGMCEVAMRFASNGNLESACDKVAASFAAYAKNGDVPSKALLRLATALDAIVPSKSSLIPFSAVSLTPATTNKIDGKTTTDTMTMTLPARQGYELSEKAVSLEIDVSSLRTLVAAAAAHDVDAMQQLQASGLALYTHSPCTSAPALPHVVPLEVNKVA